MMKDNRVVYVIFLFLLTVQVACRKQAELPVRPNILFITTDYTRGTDLPVTGAPFLLAPSLLRLCEEGAVFTRHSCNAPICMPARATIVTGHYPHVHSLWDNKGIPVKKEGRPFLISDLKNQGYQTIGIGKMHFHPIDADYDYDIRVILESKVQRNRNDDYEAYLAERGSSREEITDLKDTAGLPRAQSYFDWPLDEDLHPDAFVGIKTLDVIRNGALSGEKPWFMWVSFTGPHNPWNAPTRLTEPYRNIKDLPSGDFVDGELKTKPLDYTRHRYGYGGDLFRIYDSLPKPEQDRMRHDLRAAHYGSLSFIDEQIGRILEELEKRDALGNTLVIFTSDHGSALFDNEMLHKGAHFPTQSLVPFVVWFPGFVEPGIRNHFTSHVDLYPTLLQLAGQKDSFGVEGTSFVGMFSDPDAQIRDFVIIESTMVTSLMNKDWLIGIHHITKETDLYDLKQDPMCHHNLAENPAYNEVIEELEQKIVDWRKSLSPGGEINADPYSWYSELGDTSEISKYWKGYLTEYRRLVRVDEGRPGKIGRAASEVLENIDVGIE